MLACRLVLAMSNDANRLVVLLVIGLFLMAVALGAGFATGIQDWFENHPIAWPKIFALVCLLAGTIIAAVQLVKRKS